jgi:hypothetical protein
LLGFPRRVDDPKPCVVDAYPIGLREAVGHFVVRGSGTIIVLSSRQEGLAMGRPGAHWTSMVLPPSDDH